MFVAMTLQENVYVYRHETLAIDGQWLEYANKFARWQHPAVERGAKLALS